MDLKKIDLILKNRPLYRLKQAKEAVWRNFNTDWREATSLPQDIRAELARECPLDINAKIIKSKDANSLKIVLTLADGLKIESVLLKHRDGRHTVCVSSQVGCPLGCLFCATGKMGLKRDLTASEISEQVLFWARWLKNKSDKPNNHASFSDLKGKTLPITEKVTSLVFMGMGEPFLNYDNVIQAIKTLNDKSGLNIGARHISISTIGIAGGIKKLSLEPLQLNLAVSLHAPNDKLRSSIMPYNRAFPVKILLRETADYLKKTNRRVMIEYMMIKDFNDKEDQAYELARLLKTLNSPLFFINLILHNPTGNFEPSDNEAVKKFKNILRQQGLEVTERYRFGREIEAACGQLATN